MKYGSSLKVGAAFGLMLAALLLGIRLVSGASVADALPTAAVTAVLGGLFMGLYMRSHNARSSEAISACGRELAAKSTILLEDAAGHYRSGECVAGRLWLTDDGLFFCSQPGSLVSHRLSVPLGEISDLVPMKFAGITNGFSFETENGRESFAVGRASKWIETIGKATD